MPLLQVIRAASFKDPQLARFTTGRVLYSEKSIPLIETSLTCLWLSHRVLLSGWNKSDFSRFLDCCSCSSLFQILGNSEFCMLPFLPVSPKASHRTWSLYSLAVSQKLLRITCLCLHQSLIRGMPLYLLYFAKEKQQDLVCQRVFCLCLLSADTTGVLWHFWSSGIPGFVMLGMCSLD